MRMRRFWQKATIAALLLVSMVIGGCGKSAGDANTETDTTKEPDTKEESTTAAEEDTKKETASSDSKELTVYSAYADEESVIYFEAFEEDTGIKINYVRLSAGELFARVRSEKDNPNAALVLGGNTDYYELAKSEGLFQAYESQELENVREDIKDPENQWFPVTEHAIGFACNREWFEQNNLEYPKTWDELLTETYKDQISISHPSTAGTGYTIFMSMVEKLGEDGAFEYYSRLSDNIRQFTKSGSAPGMEVALGEAAVGIMFGDDALTVADQGYPIEVVYPEDGTGYEVTAMAILNGAPEGEAENAKTFVDWMLSVRGQEMYLESNANRTPINETARAVDGSVQLSEINLIEHDSVWASENRERLIEEFNTKIDNPENVKG